MSERNHVYEAWEERFISEEKGKRVVHYYLRSLSGRSLLAVIGTEKSRRHILYVVSEEFLREFGSNTSVDSRTKWRTRRDAVAWLISLVRKDGSQYPVASVDLVSSDKAKDHALSGEEEKKITQQNPANRAIKKINRTQELVSGKSKATNVIPEEQLAAKEPTCPKLKIKFSSNRPIGIQLVEPKPIQQASFQVGDCVEVLCQDSGLRGCWFRSKVVKVSEKRLNVQYVDLDDDEGSGKLQEWVPAPRVVTPILDKLRMRYSGRLTIRPYPPNEPSGFPLEVGTAVDAWWCDGWWEGVVTRVPLSGENNLHVYFPGEGKLMTIKREDTRISRDWVDNRWVDITPKPDVVPLISQAQM